MNNITEHNIKCVGCSACYTVCPTHAIKMKLNKEGFFEPILDKDLCVGCGKCTKVCPCLNLSEEQKPLSQYACWNNCEQDRFYSTSGGIFVGIAKKIIEKNGVVYGAAYSDDFKAVRHMSSEEVGLKALQKSKYVVSEIGDTFKQIIQYAKEGKEVLFVGTPCQCAGLKELVREYENVYLVDFICGGTPSAKAFGDYINYKEKKYGSIQSIDFRGKDTGWKKQYLSIEYKSGKKEKKYYLYDPYFSLFCIEHLSTNYSCSNCEFRKRHVSDLTIADFWGYKNANIEEDDRGLSLVAVNSAKGKKLLDLFDNKTMLPLTEKQVEYAYEKFNCDKNHEERKRQFLKELGKNDFNRIYKKYVKTDILHVYIKRIKSRLGL